MIVCVSLVSDGALLPMQVIFMGKTNHFLSMTIGAKLCLDYGFYYKEFVQKILVRCYKGVVVRMNL